MEQEIGNAAGLIWHLLKEKGTSSLNDIKRETKFTPDMINRAIGWLARESKLDFEQKGSLLLISLKPE
jgi:hypothetical protein